MDRASSASASSCWFDAARVERTVTRQFVCSHLLPDEIETLDQPLAFGDGLTDCTYWDWIQQKAKRLFLILVDLGVPDQIFGVVDDSWEDADLPIPLDHVDRLALTAARDARFDAKFYARQFFYLVRKLNRGQHVDYRDDELVPIDVVDKRPSHDPATDRVEVPGYSGSVFCRRRFSAVRHDDFMSEIDSLQSLQNDHVFSYWASYTHRHDGYILFGPVSDHKLSAFLSNSHSSHRIIDKWVRRRMVLDWIHCLIDTLAFIHSRGLFVGAIRPSSIFLTHEHHIFLPDVGGLYCPDVASQHKSTSFDKEAYDYAAPEQWFKPTKTAPTIRRHRTATTPNTPEATSSGFSISRGHAADHPSSSVIATSTVPLAQTPNVSPHLKAQAADIFALGCIILDLLSHGLLGKRRSSSAFAAHRAAKHKSAGRGGAIPDSSFHKNLGQVESWMVNMVKDAAKKAADECGDGSNSRQMAFRVVAPLLHVVEKMLAVLPSERPSAVQVQSWIYHILTETGGIAEPHCVHQYNTSSSSTTSTDLTTAEATVRTGMLLPSAFLSTSLEEAEEEEKDVEDHGGGGAPAASMRGGVLGHGVGRTHRRHPSTNSSSDSQGSINSVKSEREGWEMGSGLKAIQNLRIGGRPRT